MPIMVILPPGVQMLLGFPLPPVPRPIPVPLFALGRAVLFDDVVRSYSSIYNRALEINEPELSTLSNIHVATSGANIKPRPHPLPPLQIKHRRRLAASKAAQIPTPEPPQHQDRAPRRLRSRLLIRSPSRGSLYPHPLRC